MQNRVSLLIICIAAILCGCQKTQVDQQLDHVESIMEEHPDSALTILQQIDGTTLHGESQARHALLLSQAYDKNYIDLTNDSLISIAYNYYGNSTDIYHRMLAYHYFAVTNKNAEHYGTALHAELMAYDDAQSLNDIVNLSRSASGIARIFVMGGEYQEALRWDSIALFNAKKADKRVWLQTGYENIGEDLMALLRFHEAIQYADSAINISPKPSHDVLEIKCLSYHGLNMHSEADSIQSLMTAVGYTPTVSADYYCGKNDEEIIATQNDIIASLNERIFKITSNNLSEALYKYNVEKSHILNAKIIEKENRAITLTIISVLIIAILSLIVIAAHIKARSTRIKHENTIHVLTSDYEKIKNDLEGKSAEITQLYQDIQHLSRQNASVEEDYSKLRQEVSVAFLNKFSWVNKLGVLYLDSNLSEDKSEHLLYKKISEELAISKRKSLSSIIEKENNEHSRELLHEIDTLNLISSEKEMLLFFMAGVSTRVICYITDKSPASIYSIKTRIKSKLQSASTPFALYLTSII